MPLLLGIPIIAGLVGLFVGGQVDRAVDNATTPPAGGTQSSKMPWYVTLAIVTIAIVVVIMVIKKVLKKI